MRSSATSDSEQLRILSEHLPGGVLVMDRELRVTLWNRRLLEVLELPAELLERPGLTLQDLWRFNIERGEFGPVSDPEALVATFTERAMRFEPHAFTRVRPDGRVLEVRGEPVAGGGFVSTWTDVTEHHRLQTSLNRQDALIAQIVDHLPQAISLFDEQLRLQLWNRAFCEVLDFPPQALFRGALFEDLLRLQAERGEYGPGDPAEQVAARLQLAKRFEPHRFERTRPNGRTHLVEGRPVRFEDRLAGFVASYTDITEQKSTELKLRAANDQLEAMVAKTQTSLDQAMDQLAQNEKLAALGQLVAGVAHELNTPIGNSVLAASSFLHRVEELEAQLAAGLRRSELNAFMAFAREAAALVQDNLARAAGLIEAFKQSTIDQTSMRRRHFLLDEVVEGVCATHQHLLRPGGHRFEVDIPQGLAFHSHPGAIEQILSNLIGNTLLHGFEGRENGCIRLSAHGDADEVVLSYEDDGVGMSLDLQRHIFEPFFTTKLGRGGSGLGLHISHQLATELLGGQLSVSSRPGQGTRFTLTLPRQAEAGPESRFAGMP